MSQRKPFTRKIQDVDGTFQVSIPKGAAERLGVEKGDEVPIDVDDGRFIVDLD
jgi:AbrB family looped-hinge helix DNA binding protein